MAVDVAALLWYVALPAKTYFESELPEDDALAYLLLNTCLECSYLVPSPPDRVIIGVTSSCRFSRLLVRVCNGIASTNPC